MATVPCWRWHKCLTKWTTRSGIYICLIWYDCEYNVTMMARFLLCNATLGDWKLHSQLPAGAQVLLWLITPGSRAHRLAHRHRPVLFIDTKAIFALLKSQNWKYYLLVCYKKKIIFIIKIIWLIRETNRTKVPHWPYAWCFVRANHLARGIRTSNQSHILEYFLGREVWAMVVVQRSRKPGKLPSSAFKTI